MADHRLRRGFTLVEVLIVVVILAVLAAVVIPQFTESTQDSKESALRFNLKTVRSQLEMYRIQHNGSVPKVQTGALPQLTQPTNQNGVVGAAGPSFPFGPYIMNEMPTNPIGGSNVVTVTAADPPAAASGAGGWLYNETRGKIWADSTGYLTY